MKKCIIIILSLFVIFSLTGCGEQAAKKLEIFSWWTAGGEAEGLEAMMKIYKAKYPKDEIINATVAGGAESEAKAVLAARMQGGTPPDSFQAKAGHELIDTWVVADKMESLSFILKDNNWLDVFPKGVIDIISYNNEIYSIPVNIYRSNVLWYNISLFATKKVSPPWTMDDMLTACEKFSKAGVIPLALGDKEILASTHLFESVLSGTLGPDKYKGLWDGKTAWDSAEVKTALVNFAKLLKYVNKDHAALTWDQAVQYVIDGKCAMTIMGDWAEGYFKAKAQTPGKEFGWMPSPGTKGSFIMLSDSFGLPKGALNRKQAVQWLILCASKEGQDAFNPLKGSIPSRIDADKSLYDVYFQSAMADFSKDAIVPSVAHGAAAAEGWVTKINDIMTVFVTEMKVDKAAAELAAIAKTFVK